MSNDKLKETRALIEAVLGKTGSETPPLPDAPVADPFYDPSVSTDEQATRLIDLYFTLEDPVERDVVFDKLVPLRSTVVDEFFLSMMEMDEDEYLRAAAAAELARRGHPQALQRLEADLQTPGELFFFTNAAQVLASLRGAAFYDTLLAIWQDTTRDRAERREAMEYLEQVDLPRALNDFTAFVTGIADVHRFAEDQVEVAMTAFVRHEHLAALPVLQDLRRRILAAAWDNADERDELAAFVQEGIELLTAV